MTLTVHRASLLCFLLWVFPTLALIAQESSPAQCIEAIIATESTLTTEQQQALVEVAREALARDRIGPDKLTHLQDDFSAFWQQFMRNSGAELEMGEFALVKKLFAWHFDNYLRCPEITSEDRERTVQLFKATVARIPAIVAQAYQDTPEGVRSRLITATVEHMAQMRPTFGNYFYPRYLAADQSAGVEDVFAGIQDSGYGSRFATVQPILDNPRIAEGSKQMHIDMFVEREAVDFSDTLKKQLDRNFSTKWVAAYRNPPADLEEQVNAFREKWRAHRRQGQRPEPSLADHQAAVNRLLEGTGLEIVDGVVVDHRQSEGESASPTPAVEPEASAASHRGVILAAVAAAVVVLVLVVRRRRDRAVS